MDPEYSSEDDDEVVISPITLKSRVQQNKELRSTNNNNDRGLKESQIDDPERVKNGQELVSNGNSGICVDCVANSSNSECSEEAFHHLDSLEVDGGVKHSPESPVHSGSALRKNNTFPFHCLANGEGLVEHLPPFEVFQDAVSHLGKRLLPPIKTVAKKKHRTLSDSRLSPNHMEYDHRLQTIEGSPTKTPSYRLSEKVEFKVGDDDLSDHEMFDTSTSSDSTASLSSSFDTEHCKELDDCHVSENLQGKLLKALRLEEFRCGSPTASVASAPVFPSKKCFLLIEEDDNRSIASDTKLVRSRSDSGKRRSSTSCKDSSENIILRRTSFDEGDLQLQTSQKEDSTMKSSTHDKRSDYEDDEVSETPSMRSIGILPAIPSHGARERSYVVGNLTKHSSLLGSDELNRYFPDRRLKLFVGTWNMQKKGVPRNLNDFLLPKHQEYLQDMYVIGVQESTQDQKMWEIRLQETLGVSHVLAHSVSHGVLHMSLFVRRDLIWFCSRIEDDKVTTRMVSQIKTKGAVAIAFQFFGTSLIFVTSHFHSGENRVKERIEDYLRIKEKIKLPRRLKYDLYKSSPNDVTSRFDCTFWFGDLNFRVRSPHQIIHEKVNDPAKFLKEDDLKEVLKGDQLLAAMKRGQIFRGFNEAVIKFRPTYKFVAGSDRYDDSPKLRVPSYTDRILYKTKEGCQVECTEYNSVSTLKKSDHRPVYGFFEVGLKPGRDSLHIGGGKFRNDVYEKAARLRAQQGKYQNNSAVCNIL